MTNEGSFFAEIFLFLLVHNSEFLDNLIKNYCTMGLVLNGLSHMNIMQQMSIHLNHSHENLIAQSGFKNTVPHCPP